MNEDRWTPNQNKAMHLIGGAMDDLFAALDSSGITVADLEAIGETEIAEWFQTWLDDGDDDPTEWKTSQEVARMVHERQNPT